MKLAAIQTELKYYKFAVLLLHPLDPYLLPEFPFRQILTLIIFIFADVLIFIKGFSQAHPYT